MASTGACISLLSPFPGQGGDQLDLGDELVMHGRNSLPSPAVRNGEFEMGGTRNSTPPGAERYTSLAQCSGTTLIISDRKADRDRIS